MRIAAAAGRAVFIMTGTRVTVRGVDNLPTDHCIVVANHASYIDGVLLKGYLPGRFNFVIKGEMRDIPIVHFLLRRVGSKFVERNEHSGSARDARQIVKAAQGGESLQTGDMTRKLKKLLQDAGVVPWMRDRIPLLYSGERLIAVADLWMDQSSVETPGVEVRWENHPALY